MTVGLDIATSRKKNIEDIVERSIGKLEREIDQAPFAASWSFKVTLPFASPKDPIDRHGVPGLPEELLERLDSRGNVSVGEFRSPFELDETGGFRAEPSTLFRVVLDHPVIKDIKSKLKGTFIKQIELDFGRDQRTTLVRAESAFISLDIVVALKSAPPQ